MHFLAAAGTSSAVSPWAYLAVFAAAAAGYMGVPFVATAVSPAAGTTFAPPPAVTVNTFAFVYTVEW